MEEETSLHRVGSGVSLPMSLLLGIFFFLPWVSIQCGGMEIGEASGWQLTVGTASESSMLETAESKPQAGAGSLGEHVDARPWFILGLVVPVAVLVIGLKGFNGTMPSVSCGKALMGLGALGVMVVLLAANVDYSEIVTKNVNSQCARLQSAQGPGCPAAFGQDVTSQMEEQLASQLKTRGTGILWASLVLHILVAACGAANLLLPNLAASPQQAAGLPPVEIQRGPPRPPAGAAGRF
ncbi:MAG: hypothetical protein ACYTF6_03025 [Planctomycetota bacterium]|jgi:hypothetical protein